MKKKLAIIAAACALVLAIPAAAFAADLSPISRSAQTERDADVCTIYVQASIPAGTSGDLRVEATYDDAGNVVLNLGDKIAGSFILYTVGDLEEADVTGKRVTVNLDPKYAGHQIRLFLEHANDPYSCDSYEGVLSSAGSYTFNISTLGTLTFTVSGEIVGPVNPPVDPDPTSPQTGMDPMMAVVAVATIICAAGAIALARNLRKENE